MKKFKGMMDKPMTWGSYLKVSGICTAISMIIGGVEMAVIFWDSIRDKLDELNHKLPWNRNK